MLKWNDSEAVNKNMSYDEPRAVYFFLPFSLFFQSFSFLFFFFFSVLHVLAPVIILHALRSLRKEDSNKNRGITSHESFNQ